MEETEKEAEEREEEKWRKEEEKEREKRSRNVVTDGFETGRNPRAKEFIQPCKVKAGRWILPRPSD